VDNVYDASPDIEYFRAKLARQVKQFCRACARAYNGGPTPDDIHELFRSTEKTKKQIELLEDAVVIHHLKHDERRTIWYIDTNAIRDFKECLKDKKSPST
jgi:hypothetical protein